MMPFRSQFGCLLFVTALFFLGKTAYTETPGTAAKAPGESPAENGNQQKPEVRKIISAEADPSLMLEPIPEAPEDKRKKVPEKPQRPQPPSERAVASSGLMGLGAALNSGPATGNSGSSGGASNGGSGKGINQKFGRLPGEAPASPEIAVILHDKQFFPSRLRMKSGMPTKLYFITTGERAAAIVIEQLQVQKWVGKESSDRKPASEYDRAKFEASREITKHKMTEIMLDPRRGSYSFHDAITGAKGQIIVD